MRQIVMLIFASIIGLFGNQATAASLDNIDDVKRGAKNIQVGPRPYFLVDDMDPGPLKATLKQCDEKPLSKTDFSIGHRAPRCNSRSIPKSLTKPPLGWARESSNAM